MKSRRRSARPRGPARTRCSETYMVISGTAERAATTAHTHGGRQSLPSWERGSAQVKRIDGGIAESGGRGPVASC